MKKGLLKYIIILIFFSGVYYFFFRGEYSVFKISEYEKKIAKLKKDTLELKSKIRDIEKRSYLLKKGNKFEIEKNAREKYDYKNEGEKIYKYKVKKGD